MFLRYIENIDNDISFRYPYIKSFPIGRLRIDVFLFIVTRIFIGVDSNTGNKKGSTPYLYLTI